jgi:para-nitrobenzyl esterase
VLTGAARVGRVGKIKMRSGTKAGRPGATKRAIPHVMTEPSSVHPDRPIVHLKCGALAGARNGTIRSFLGVPYAAPPVGDRRFAEPEPVRVWDGKRDATVAGPSAPQRIKPFPALDLVALVGEGGERGDDYLTCNIWTPDGAEQCPVMVWIHGGGFVIGNTDAPVQKGETFARDGVVCVAINYRMGIDGFLPIPGVPTNLGLRDMIAALGWVRDNIVAFGGDPANVTVFGESAGAMAIADLITSPLAKGLFRRAIVQSGHGSMVRSIPVAQRVVTRLAKELRIAPTREGFASANIDKVIDAIEKIAPPTAKLDLRDEDGIEPVFGISRFIPVLGDDVLPEHPLVALAGGVGAEVDVLIGSNAEEMNLYFVPTGVKQKLRGFIGRFFARKVFGKSHPQAKAILKAYGMGTRGRTPGEAFADASSDLVFRWPARRFAEEHRGRTYMYELDWRSPACGGALGACHGLDVPFVFDALDVATGEKGLAGSNPPQALATRVHSLWVRFATDGSLPWPEFNAETREVYQLAKGYAVREPVMPIAPFLP